MKIISQRKTLLFFIFISLAFGSFRSNGLIVYEKEDIVFLAENDLFDKGSFITKNGVQIFLQKHAISIEELYQLLKNRKGEVDTTIEQLQNTINSVERLIEPPIRKMDHILRSLAEMIIGSPREGLNGPELVASIYGKMFSGLLYGIIGNPTFLFGIRRYFKTQTQKSSTNAINLGLIVAGGILSIPLNTYIFLETILPRLIPSSTKDKFLAIESNTRELNIINRIMNNLKKMYPELSQY